MGWGGGGGGGGARGGGPDLQDMWQYVKQMGHHIVILIFTDLYPVSAIGLRKAPFV